MYDNEVIKEKSWFKRNWKWAVPVGGCLTLIILAIVFIGSIIYGVSSVITKSTPYKDGLEKANENSYVEQTIGHPVETDGMMRGNLSLSNDDGEVDIKVPIKGSKAEGTLIVVGEKKDGEWSYEELYILVDDTGEKIDLQE